MYITCAASLLRTRWRRDPQHCRGPRAQERHRQEVSEKRSKSGAQAKKTEQKISTQNNAGVRPSWRSNKDKNLKKASTARKDNTYACIRCGQVKSKAEFETWQTHKRKSSTRECNDCIQARDLIIVAIVVKGSTKEMSFMHADDRKRDRKKTAQCKVCRDEKGRQNKRITCCNCGRTKPKSEFNSDDRKSKRIDNKTSQCTACREGGAAKRFR